MVRIWGRKGGTLPLGSRLRRWVCLVLPMVMIATASPSWAANEKDVDFDWLARNLDKLIKGFAPTFPVTFAGTDGDSNGIKEDDTLAMFGAVLRGNVSPRLRVNGVSSTEQEAMRLDFVNNRISADDHMRATGLFGLNCTLLRAVITDIPDCKLSSVLKSTQTLGPDVGALVGDLLLDLISALLTSGDYNNNDTTATLGYVNTVIGSAIQAAADALGQGGLGATLAADYKITNTEFANNYERWGLNPRPTGGSPARRNAFGPAGNLDNGVDATTNLAEYTAAGQNRETWLNTNGIGVYPTGITNDQPIRLTTQPASGVYAAGTNVSFPMSFVGGGNASPYTYLWEDAEDFGDADSPNAATYYGIIPYADGGSISGSATTTLTITDLTYATHDNMRPWLRISDAVTIYNTLPRGNGAPAGSAAADALGGRATGFGQIKVVEVLANATTRGPVSQCSGPITFNVYASNGDDSADGDTDSDPPTYLWYKGATPGTLVSTGITTNTLSIANVVAGDAGYYACDVSHYFNSGSTVTRTNLVQLVFPSAPVAPSVPDLAAGSDSGTSNSDNITNDTTPTFSGTGTVGDTITITVDGNNNNTAVVDGSGNWSITTTAITPGVRTIAAFGTNCTGSGPSSSGLSVTIDTTPPAAPSAPDLAAASDSGTFNSDDITNDNTPNLSGTAEAGATVAVISSLNGAIGNSAGPNYLITSTTLVDGVHNVVATATDNAGNTSANSGTLSLTIDTTAPAAPSIPDLAAGSDSGSSSTDNITNVTGPTLTGTAESGAIVRVFSSVAGQIGTSAGPSYSINSVALADNVHSITANATDAAGNTSVTSSGLAVTIDTAGPVAPSVPNLDAASDSGSSNTDNLTNITLPGFTGTAETGSTVTLLVDGSPNGTQAAPAGTYTALAPSVALTSGVRNISARATDAAGNTGTASAALPVTIDITAPAQPGLPDLLAGSDSGTSSTDNITNDTTPDLTGTAEADSVVTVTSSLAGVLGTPTATGGNWSLTPGLSEGVHSITVTARDAAGNTSVSSTALSVTIDTTAPAAPGTPDLVAASDTGSSNSDNLTNDTTPDITGAAISGNSVSLSSSIAGAIGSGASSGTYTITSSVLADGIHNITATQTDPAGNTSGSSAGLSVTVDTVSPTVSAESPNRGVTLAALPSIQVTFSKPISGLAAGNLTVNGNAATGLSGSGAGPYTFNGYTAPGDGTVNVVLSGAGATGIAGNALTGDSWTYTQNSNVPTVTLSTVTVTNGGTTNVSPIGFTAAFSEGVTGLLQGEISVTGGTVTFYLPLSATTYIFQVTPSGQGAVSVTIPAAVAQATVPPNSDNTASNTYAYTYDSIAPTVTVGSLTTNDNRPALGGNVNDNTAAISITVASQTVAGVNNGDGTWSLAANILTAIADGTYDVVVTATDTATNAGTDATIDELTIDATPPAVTVDFLTTADNTPALSGTIDDPTATLSVQVGSQTFVGTNNGDGTWDLADNTLTALSDGTVDVIVTATDSLTNSAQDATTGELTIDTTPPVVAVDALLTNDTTPELSGTVDDVTATVSIQIGVQIVSATNNGDGTWTLADNTLTALADAVYNVIATATDTLGNAAFDAGATELTVDTTGPVITLNGSGTLNVNCGDGYSDQGATALDARQGDTTGDIVVTGDTVTAFSLPGNYQITYNVSDSLGNAGAQVVRNITVLANCPLTVTENAGNVTKDEGDTHTFSVTVTGAIGALDYQWQKDDGSKAWQDISGETTDSYTIPVLSLADSGEYRCEVSDAVTTAYSGTILLTVETLAGVPAAGLAGLSIATVLTALAGAAALRRKR
jgi:hypothetical protein